MSSSINKHLDDLSGQIREFAHDAVEGTAGVMALKLQASIILAQIDIIRAMLVGEEAVR